MVVGQRLVVVQDSVLLHLVAAINKVVLLVRVLETAMPEILSEVEPVLVVASAALVEEATVEAVSERKPSQVVDLVVLTPATTSKVTRSQAADFPVLDKIFFHLLFHNFSLRIYFMIYDFTLMCRLKHV